MKKNLMALMIIIVFGSCEQGNNATSNTGNLKDYQNSSPSIDSILIPLSKADTLIYNYNEYLMNIQHDSLAYSSFMLNANALRDYLNANQEISSLNVYLAKVDRGPMTDTSMTLVYIGAKDSVGYDVEQPYIIPGDPSQTPYFLDQVMPCPVCVDRIEAYQPPNVVQ